MILGLKSHSSIHHISPIPLTTPIRKPQTTLKPSLQFPPNQTHTLSHLQLKSRRTNPNGFKSSSSKESIGNDGGGDAGAEEDLKEGGGDDDELRRVDLKWNELVLDPDRDNVVAVGLMGALVWASVRVMWQVFVVTMAILIAAVKYTFVGVVLIFVVITLL